MALQNATTNEYLKIAGLQFNVIDKHYFIEYYIFKDAEQRKRFGNLNEYEAYKRGMFDNIAIIGKQMEALIDNITVQDAILAACYKSLKQDIFKEWQDV